MKQKKKQTKYKTSVINGVRVTSATKREFYQNREYYKNQGIKSAQRLQEERNIKQKIKRSQNKTRELAIRKAFNLDIDKYKTLGYTVEQFIKIYKSFQKWNEKIEDAIKKGKILRTSRLSFPIDFKGHINLKRLAIEIRNSKKTITQIKKAQKDYIFNNFYEVYGNHENFRLFTKLYNKMDVTTITKLMDYVELDFLFRYDIRDFTDEARENFWYGIKEETHKFNSLIVAMADELNDYAVLGVFGL